MTVIRIFSCRFSWNWADIWAKFGWKPESLLRRSVSLPFAAEALILRPCSPFKVKGGRVRDRCMAVEGGHYNKVTDQTLLLLLFIPGLWWPSCPAACLRALVEFPAAWCDCSCQQEQHIHSWFLCFTHTFSILLLSCLFTCPPMGCGLHFCGVFFAVCLCKWAPVCWSACICPLLQAGFSGCARMSVYFPLRRLCALRLLIMEKVAEGNHNRYKLLRGGRLLKEQPSRFQEEKKRAGEKCF